MFYISTQAEVHNEVVDIKELNNQDLINVLQFSQTY